LSPENEHRKKDTKTNRTTQEQAFKQAINAILEAAKQVLQVVEYYSFL